MWLGIVSLFPQQFNDFMEFGVVGRALKAKNNQVEFFNPRDHTSGNYKQVDDKPYGGGCGMLLQCAPMQGAIEAAKQKAESLGHEKVPVVFFSPQGRVFNHPLAVEYAGYEALILVSGCYEGIDERVIENYADDEISIGNYVLSSGELPIMVFVNAIGRLWDETLGNSSSAVCDSFNIGLLKGPQYTRPAEFQNSKVPEELLSGNHKEIACWERRQAIGRTWVRLPLLLMAKPLSIEDNELLMEFIDKQLGDI